MHFAFVDSVLERTEDRIVTLKQVSNAEEYLLDHFPGFPVLPGVLMVESLVQAARALMVARADEGVEPRRLVLGAARGVKYGTFVRPGESLRVEVTLKGPTGDGGFEFRGEGLRIRPEGVGGGDGGTGGDGEGGERQVAVAGRFTLRPVRVHAHAGNA